MDDVKKHARYPHLSEESNHDIYERWRAADAGALSGKAKAEYEEAVATSRRVYDLAFCETLKRTTLVLWESIFDGWAK